MIFNMAVQTKTALRSALTFLMIALQQHCAASSDQRCTVGAETYLELNLLRCALREFNMILEVDVLDRDARRTGSEAAKGKQAAE